MQKITPFLWFNDKAEEAANFYTSIFKNAKVTETRRYGETGPGKNGSIMSATINIEGQDFILFNGGPHFTFSPAMSLFVRCQTQDEVDKYWNELSAGGETLQCGWLKDKYGVTWQVVPTVLGEMLQDKDAKKSTRVMAAMMKMNKLDINGLKQAYEQ